MTSSIREKKTKRSPAMTTADVVAVVHLLVANVVYFVGQYTRVFSGMSLVEPGKMLVYHYIDYPVNLNEVLFIATSNNIDNLSTAVINRLEVINMPTYSDEEMPFK